MDNKIGIYYAYWAKDWKADFIPYIKKVKTLGFDILEIAAGSLPELPKYKLTEIAKVANDNNIELTYCIGFPGDKDLSSLDEKVRRDGIEYAKKLLDCISIMGGRILGGIIYASWPSVPGVGLESKKQWWEHSVTSVKEVGKVAENCGVLYCLEVVNRFECFLLNTVDEGKQFVREVENKNVKLLLDNFHMNIEEDYIGQSIIKAGCDLGHFHIGECNRKVPGRGHMPWEEIMDALVEIDYSGAVVMEPFVKMGGEVGRDIRVWRDLSDQADEMKMDEEARFALDFVRNAMKSSVARK